jgi:hypothetical protein
MTYLFKAAQVCGRIALLIAVIVGAMTAWHYIKRLLK